ncbi:MAG: hypothetical protein LT071_05690 [Nocardioides sp.]|nr:hypothetical protein [Nocardioides sp.]
MAVAIGVVVGGGLMVVTPAGATVQQAAATNWAKIWKQKLRPLADKRFYTKGQSDTRFARKGSSFTKAESEARYADAPTLIRGGWGASGYTNGAGNLESPIDFGVTLSAPPEAHYVLPGAAPSTACPGTLAAPDAAPGHLCVYEQSSGGGLDARMLCSLRGVCGAGVDAFGGFVIAFDNTAGADRWMRGTWALRPGGAAVVSGRTAVGGVSEPLPDGDREAGMVLLR